MWQKHSTWLVLEPKPPVSACRIGGMSSQKLNLERQVSNALKLTISPCWICCSVYIVLWAVPMLEKWHSIHAEMDTTSLLQKRYFTAIWPHFCSIIVTKAFNMTGARGSQNLLSVHAGLEGCCLNNLNLERQVSEALVLTQPTSMLQKWLCSNLRTTHRNNIQSTNIEPTTMGGEE